MTTSEFVSATPQCNLESLSIAVPLHAAQPESESIGAKRASPDKAKDWAAKEVKETKRTRKTKEPSKAKATSPAPDVRTVPPGLVYQRRAETPVLCFASGRGSVGKTTTCAVAGIIAAHWNMRVTLLDLDLAFGNLYSLLGLDRPCDLLSIREESSCTPENIDACGRQAHDHVQVWGPCQSPEHAELVQPLVENVIARLTQTHDLVLIDTTTNWGDALACAAQLSDRLLIVSDERSGNMPALAQCGSLATRLGIALTRIVRLMNGCDPRDQTHDFTIHTAQGLECARELRVFDGGFASS